MRVAAARLARVAAASTSGALAAPRGETLFHAGVAPLTSPLYGFVAWRA